MPKKTEKPIEVSDLKDLRLIELGAENYKRVKAVRIRPTSSLTQITGRNAQGKSSVLEAFLSLFEGKAGVAVKPIRVGEAEASSYVILGHGGKPLVTISQRIWEKKGGGLAREIIVEGADGTNFNSPQTIASALYAPIAFDPFAFQRMDDKAKVELLKRLVPGVDFGQMAKQRLALFNKRTDTGRDRDRAQAAAAAIEVTHDTPETEIDESGLTAELAGVADFNAEIEQRATRRRTTQEGLDDLLNEIEQLEATLATKKREAAQAEAKIAGAEPLPAKKSTAAIEAKISNARSTNVEVRLQAQRTAQVTAHKNLATEYDLLTADIAKLDADKIAAIAKAKLPVRGLEFDDDGVTLNGLPFAQASSAEQLKASTLLAMATNPDLKVVIIREGSLLDDDSLEMITAMAAERGYDLLVERVTNGEKIGIVIEDGEVAS